MPEGRRIIKYTALAAAAAGVFFLLAAADLGLRSRSALLEARRHSAWAGDPQAKKAHFEEIYRARAAELDARAGAGRLTAEEAGRQKLLAAAERDFLVEDSSAKQAYIWYRTAARDFKSPLNPWAAKAEKELPAARAAWEAELQASGARPEPWMLE